MTAIDTNVPHPVRDSESELQASSLAPVNPRYAPHRPASAYAVQQPMPAGVSAIWSLFRRQYWVVVLGVFGGALLASLYCLFATPIYQANVKIWVSQKESTKPVLGANSGQEQAASVGEEILATHMEIMASPLVVEDALATGSIGARIDESIDRDETAVEYVMDHLRVTKGGEGGGRSAHILNLSFRHTSAEDCQAVLSSLVDSYRRCLDKIFQQDQGEALQLAERHRDKTEAELSELRQKRQELPWGGFWNGPHSVNAHQDKVEGLVAESWKIKDELISTASKLDTLLAAQSDSQYVSLQLLTMVDPQHLERIKLLVEVPRGGSEAQLRQSSMAEHQSLLFQKRLALVELFSKYGDDHPKVKRVQKTIHEINALLRAKQLAPEDKVTPATVVDSYIALLRSDLANLESQQREIETLLVSEQKKVADLVLTESEDEKLQNQIVTHEIRLQTAEDRVMELELEKAYAGFKLEVIAPAKLGEQVAPKPALFIAIGAILGMCLGTVLAVARDNMGQTFCGDDDLRWTLGLPVLGTFCVRPSGRALTNGRPSPLDPTLVTHHRPASREAEAFRNLRAMICHGRHGGDIQLIQVTGVGPGQGKTTLAANLAICLARGRNKVLFVDADLQCSAVAERFSIQSAHGLSTLLARDDQVHQVVCQTEVENLWLVPAGPHTAIAADLLTRRQFTCFLNQMCEEYDFVILDSPAMPAADSIQIASQADVVLLTIDVEKTPGDQAAWACDMLSSLDAKILGVVVDASSRTWRSSFQASGGRANDQNDDNRHLETPPHAYSANTSATDQ